MYKDNELRVQILNPYGMTPDDAVILEALRDHPPMTKIQTGDLVRLTKIPKHLNNRELLPQVWEVRMVVSKYQLALHNLLHESGGAIDYCFNQLEISRSVSPGKYREPIIYAHGFPHGAWPSSAEWIPEKCLSKIPMRAPTEEWRPILDEFSTPFQGYDPHTFGAGVVFDLAPDIYDDQRSHRNPLSFEESTFHHACTVGLEELCMVPIDPKTNGFPTVGIWR